MPQWNFWFFISFVVFGAAVYGPSSSMVDYTAERRKTERERKGKCFSHYITCGPTTQREEVLCEKEKLNFKIFIMPQWMDERTT